MSKSNPRIDLKGPLDKAVTAVVIAMSLLAFCFIVSNIVTLVQHAEPEFVVVDKGPLKVGETTQGTISASNERHVYHFDTSGAQTLTLNIIPASKMHVFVQVLDSGTGDELIRFFSDTMSLDESEIATVEIKVPKSGTYGIVIDPTEQAVGEYIIKIETSSR